MNFSGTLAMNAMHESKAQYKTNEVESSHYDNAEWLPSQRNALNILLNC